MTPQATGKAQLDWRFDALGPVIAAWGAPPITATATKGATTATKTARVEVRVAKLGLTLGNADAAWPRVCTDAVLTCLQGRGRTAIALAAGGTHTCALLDDHAVKCWGSATSGQLGLGDTVTRGDAPGEMGDALAAVDLGPLDVVALRAGSYFTCATSSTGVAACWGGNSEGQLGIGSSATRGDGPGVLAARRRLCRELRRLPG